LVARAQDAEIRDDDEGEEESVFAAIRSARKHRERRRFDFPLSFFLQCNESEKEVRSESERKKERRKL
jgi:hypothetical protein